jgi:hypothetical protein
LPDGRVANSIHVLFFQNPLIELRPFAARRYAYSDFNQLSFPHVKQSLSPLLGDHGNRSSEKRFSMRVFARVATTGQAGMSAPESVRGRRGGSPLQVYAHRPVTERNCVTAKWGGEQREVNNQSDPKMFGTGLRE